MFDIFGEFDSAEDINQAAEGLKKEGDLENLKVLAKENGIEEEFVQAYTEEYISVLTDITNAAIGKLSVERENIKSQMPVRPIVDYLNTLCMDETIARIIRSKKKSLKGCITEVEKKCKAECTRAKEQYIADMTVFKWARAYYMED